MKTPNSPKSAPAAPTTTEAKFEFDFESEFGGAKFGDRRLNKRAVHFTGSALRHPETSIPTMAGGAGAAAGVYKFIANPKVTMENIAQAHQEQTVTRCQQAKEAVLLLHDSTTFGYGKDTKRTGLGPIAGGGMGFLAHVTLAIGEDSTRPLGILKCKPLARPVPDPLATPRPKGTVAKRDRRSDVENEGWRWFEQATETGRMLGEVARVHVADRESDDYKYFWTLAQAQESLVTRVSGNRVLAGGVDLFATMDGMVVQLCRTVRLSRRAPGPGPAQRKANPPRDERMAKLEISSGSICIPRPPRTPSRMASTLKLNYVLVREIETPADDAAVTWRLVTDLPVSTPEEIARVVDIYRKRWNIEELFKSLKTGCSFNDHQLESYEGLSKLLALLLPVAWKLLDLRTVARMQPEAPATVVLTAQQVQCLRVLHDKQHPKAKMAAKPTVIQAMYALAALGGHFKQNGAPGWQTLGRGLQRVLQAEEDALAMLEHFRMLELAKN
jgi:hypothetical protein